MIGAIVGDVVGSIYEFCNIRTKEFPLLSPLSAPTDDTVMTLAVAELLQRGDLERSTVVETFKRWGRAYPDSGYGGRFAKWLFSSDTESYASYGNGAAMRVSPVGWYAKTEGEVKELSRLVTEVTHSHEEGLKGAEVTAMSVFMARNGASKKDLYEYASKYYNLFFDYEDLRKNYRFNETCQASVPQAIFCFLISESFEDCLRTTVSIGGDCDTTAAISCAIAEAYYGKIDEDPQAGVLDLLPAPSGGANPQRVVQNFLKTYYNR